MPLTLPRSVERSLGQEAAQDFTLWFEDILIERAVHRDEYREVLSRLDILEHDMADVKTAIRDLHQTMDERFDRMNSEMNERFDRMHSEMNGRFDQMNERITTMMRWTVGTLALLGTIISILLAIAQFA